MKAVVFRNQKGRQAMAKLGGYLTPEAFVAGFAPTRLEDVPDPEPPGPGWVVCSTDVTGICGSDSKQVFLHGSRSNPLTALISFPHVIGHEAVARRSDTGVRVVVNPWLGCIPRGIDPPCDMCARGEFPHCRHFTDGILAPSLHLGNCADAGGTHAERFAAHESCLHELPDGVDDETAVLADPASVSLRQVLRNPPDPATPAVVYGCGTLGLCAIALLRHLHPDQAVWAISHPGRPAELAAKMGADEVIVAAGPDDVVRRVAALSALTPYQPWSKRPWIRDGPGTCYDTVGSPETVETAMRFLGVGATLSISGVEAPRRFEWTPLYHKELHVTGSNAFGIEELDGVRAHAFVHYFALVEAGLDVTPIITHRFPLREWNRAYVTIARRRRTGAVKVLMRP